MLINHEGIPGSGKTFEAVSKHLIPALKKGRSCFVRINGLNYPQLASLAAISEESCRAILIHIDDDAIQKIDEYKMPNGSLVIIDELQNYFPNQRKPLNQGVTKFVAEHRHLGLDIVFMCQDLKDCHSIWRRRVDTKIVFTKLDMLGSKKYHWKLFKAVAPEKFREVSSGQSEYDKAIFGSYASFQDGAEDTQSYDDKRRSIWSSKLFSRWLPLAAIASFIAVGYLWHLFSGGGLQSSFTKSSASSGTPRMSVDHSILAPVAVGSPAVIRPGVVPPVAPPAPPPELKKYQRDFIQDLSEKYRLRLSGVAKSASHMWGVFEWYDDGFHIKERLSIQAVQHLGYVVDVDDRLETATITKGDWRYVATEFPLDEFGQISDEREREIAKPGHPPHVADIPAEDDDSPRPGVLVLESHSPAPAAPPADSSAQTINRPPSKLPVKS